MLKESQQLSFAAGTDFNAPILFIRHSRPGSVFPLQTISDSPLCRDADMREDNPAGTQSSKYQHQEGNWFEKQGKGAHAAASVQPGARVR